MNVEQRRAHTLLVLAFPVALSVGILPIDPARFRSPAGMKRVDYGHPNARLRDRHSS